MAVVKTFADLKSDVQKWLNRNDPEIINMIPSFIALAEQEFSRVIKIPMDEGHYQKQVGIDETYITIPDDLMSPIAVYVNAQPYTRVNGFGYFKTLASSGEGQYFAKYEDRFLFTPELQVGDVVVITYHKELKPLETDNDTNAALEYGYDLMLYWALKHASMFLRDPENEQYWSGKAQEAAITLDKTFNEMHWAGSPLKVLRVAQQNQTQSNTASVGRVGVWAVNNKTGYVTLNAEDVGAYSKSESDSKYEIKGQVTGAVTSVNGLTGAVVINAASIGAVPVERTINGKALSSNITISAADVGSPTIAEVNSQFSATVPKTRTINGHTLDADVTITASDVGTYTSSEIDSKIAAGGGGSGTSGVTSVNGHTGVVTLTATDVGAMATGSAYTKSEADAKFAVIGSGGGAVDLSNYYTKSEVNTKLGTKVDKTITVNGHALDANVTLTATDLNLYTKDEIDGMIPSYTTATAGLDLDKVHKTGILDIGPVASATIQNGPTGSNGNRGLMRTEKLRDQDLALQTYYVIDQNNYNVLGTYQRVIDPNVSKSYAWFPVGNSGNTGTTDPLTLKDLTDTDDLNGVNIDGFYKGDTSVALANLNYPAEAVGKNVFLTVISELNTSGDVVYQALTIFDENQHVRQMERVNLVGVPGQWADTGVDTANDQNIYGIKSFKDGIVAENNIDFTNATSVSGPDPSDDANFATKKYVDDKVSAGGGSGGSSSGVTLDTEQTITGKKTFTGGATFSGDTQFTVTSTVDMQNAPWIVISNPAYDSSPTTKRYVDAYAGTKISAGVSLNDMIQPGLKYIAAHDNVSGMGLPNSVIGEACMIFVSVVKNATDPANNPPDAVTQKLWVASKNSGVEPDVKELIRCKFGNTWTAWMQSTLHAVQ